MDGKFDTNVMKLEKTIFNISKNFYKFKNKNHKTLVNIVEKIKSFSNEIMDSQKDTPNISKRKINNSYKRTLKKSYQNIFHSNLSNTLNNRINQYENNNNNKIPKIFKENNSFKHKENTSVLYINKNFYDKKVKILSNINNISISKNDKIKKYLKTDKIKKKNNNNSSKKKYFSFNYDFFNSCVNDNDNDIRQRTYSSNNFKINNIFKNDLFKDILNEDLNYSRINKNKQDKKMDNNSSNKGKDIASTINSKKQRLSYSCSDNSREIKNIKREKCNINISDFYKNINKKENIKKNNEEKDSINTNKINNKNNIKNGNNNVNYSSRNFYFLDINNITNTNSINNEKEYENKICSTYNPNYNKYENEKNMDDDETQRDIPKNGYSQRGKNSKNNNLVLNTNINTLNRVQYNNEKNNEYFYNNNINNNYYQSFRGNNKKTINYNNEDSSKSYGFNSSINTQKTIIKQNNNYNKDFIEIVTNNSNGKKNYVYINEEKYNILLSKLKCNNIDECISKIDNLIIYEDFIYKLNSLYNKNNNNNFYNFYKYKEKIKKNLNNFFSWIESIINENKKIKENLKKYQSFCGKLTEEFNGDEFDKFKNFIVKTLYKNKKIQSLESSNNNRILSDFNSINTTSTLNNKENKSICFYNSDEYSTLKNRAYSYSEISINKFNNEDNNFYGNSITNFFISNKSNKRNINKK